MKVQERGGGILICYLVQFLNWVFKFIFNARCFNPMAIFYNRLPREPNYSFKAQDESDAMNSG